MVLQVAANVNLTQWGYYQPKGVQNFPENKIYIDISTTFKQEYSNITLTMSSDLVLGNR